jgi:UDP-glucose 4-epimerase
VGDAIDAIMNLTEGRGTGVWNIGPADSCTITDSIGWICQTMEVRPTLTFTGGDKGWVGDAPNLTPDPAKLYSTGWRPSLTIEQSVKVTVGWMLDNKEILK